MVKHQHGPTTDLTEASSPLPEERLDRILQNAEPLIWFDIPGGQGLLVQE
jgi:hypothetical protein